MPHSATQQPIPLCLQHKGIELYYSHAAPLLRVLTPARREHTCNACFLVLGAPPDVHGENPAYKTHHDTLSARKTPVEKKAVFEGVTSWSRGGCSQPQLQLMGQLGGSGYPSQIGLPRYLPPRSIPAWLHSYILRRCGAAARSIVAFLGCPLVAP